MAGGAGSRYKRWRNVLLCLGVAPSIALMVLFSLGEVPVAVYLVLAGTAVVDVVLLQGLWIKAASKLRQQGWEW